MSMNNRLLPCPFCGRSDCLLIEHMEGTVVHPTYRVCCDNCGASSRFTDKGHIEAWNSRATQPAAGEPVAIRLPAKCPEKTLGENPLRTNYAVGWDDCLEAVLALNAPPAAAHGNEAVRKDAEAAYIEMTCQPVLIDGAHHYYLSSERMQAFDRLFSVDVSDAAMRAQAGEGGE